MGSRVGLKINQDKAKVMEIGRIHHLHGNSNIGGMEVEAVESFKYLGTTMSHNAKMTEEVAARIGAANRCYFSFLDLFKRRSTSRKTKIRIYNTVIRPVLIYGCETWSLTKSLESSFEVFENKILRRIAGPVYDQDRNEWRHPHNREVRDATGQSNICSMIRSRRMQWAGHMDEDRMPKENFLSEVVGRRPVGRTRKDWRRCSEEDIHISGGNPDDWFETAQSREEWRILSRAVMGQQVAQASQE